MAALRVCVLIWVLVTVVPPRSMQYPDTPAYLAQSDGKETFPRGDYDAERDPREDYDDNSDSGSGMSKDPGSSVSPEEPGKNAADGNGPLANLCVLCAAAALYLLA
ncbi:hypothetical protein OJAV_G00184060 [Oryzias javanicus]|uniref:Uncharacterized protein n=1 Tax=Oryzias javanicus TaxID=123683 RepID=A0A3S2P9B1_ORYJA|nr:hypothetical protein OJAV_G00184060 [Oryzias javanicus]